LVCISVYVSNGEVTSEKRWRVERRYKRKRISQEAGRVRPKGGGRMLRRD